MPMDSLLRRRALGASVWSASIVGGIVVLCASCAFDRLSLLSLIVGTLVLGPAQMLRAAAVLRRGPTRYSASRLLPRLRSAAVAVVSVAMTALASTLFLVGLGGADDDARVFGGFLGLVALARLWMQGALEWTALPREASHRRVKAKLLGIIAEATLYSMICILLAAWSEGALFVGALHARLMAGMVVLVASGAHAEALQGCTSLLAAGELPRGTDLIEALAQPLSVSPGSPGLGRWLALTALAQAASHRQFGPLCRRSAESRKFNAGGRQSSLPPLAMEVFCLSNADGRRLGKTSTNDFAFGAPTAATSMQSLGMTSAQGDPGSGSTMRGTRGAADLGRGVVSSGFVPTGRGLFAAYLASGLEVLREFAIRVQCLVEAPSGMCRPSGLSGRPASAELQDLGAGIVEMVPLMRVSAAGLSGWICLSRDFDEAGVVQREEALRKAIYELCGLLLALDRVRPLLVCGALDLSATCAAALKEGHEEARHSLMQLLLAFEHAGLREVSLPPEYQRFITDFCG